MKLIGLALLLLVACGKSTGDAPGGEGLAGNGGSEPAGGAAGSADGGVIADAGHGAGGAGGGTTHAGGTTQADGGGAEADPGMAGTGGEAGSAPCFELSCLAGARFVYVPTREWQRPSGSVGSELSEADYSPLLGPTWQVTFADDAQQVQLSPSAGGDSVQGLRQTPPVDKARFELSLFAGGRFVVWQGDAQWQAEYTVYGSGQPIISSTRGYLASP